MRKFLSLAVLAVVATATPVAAADLSKSIMRPTPVSNGVVAGNLPGGEGSASYYIAVDLKQGQLMTQLGISGRANSDKKLTFELLNADARVAASTYVMAGLDAKAETTKSFPIDSAGRYVIRITTEGKETGTYCVLMGGPAMPNAGDAACPTERAALSAPVPPPPPPPPRPIVTEVHEAPAPPPAVGVVPAVPPAVVAEPPRPRYEVIVSKCEERLRIGSDFLFDFDRAEVRPEAGPTLDEIAEHLTKEPHSVMVEGHTDGKGTDRYNQTLSERRAIAIRASLTTRGLPISELNIRGYGKSRPVAPNENVDGSDNPEGRQKNRRVEVVVNTCQ